MMSGRRVETGRTRRIPDENRNQDDLTAQTPTSVPDTEETPAPQDRQPPTRTFASLGNRNFRLFLAGLFVSGTGAWVQRIAQDWLVLHPDRQPGRRRSHDGVPVPADPALRAPRGGARRPLQQASHPPGHPGQMAVMAALLAVLTLTGAVQTWHVYVFAAALGVVDSGRQPGAAVVRHRDRRGDRTCAARSAWCRPRSSSGRCSDRYWAASSSASSDPAGRSRSTPSPTSAPLPRWP